MQREERVDVLVVGAGPVGMFNALLLAEAGLRVKIIDQESRTTSRTYACALHPRTLQLLNRLGLAKPVLEVGRRIDATAFYEGASRRADARLSQLPGEFPFVLVLSQSAFEHLLEEKLKQDGRVQVKWNHHLSDWHAERDGVVATVQKLGVSAKGFIVPEMEWSVQRTETIRAAFVIGADGPNSFVAKSLGLGFESIGQPEFFAVYEFASDWSCGDELRVVLDAGTTSVLWPLPENRFRWSFQLLQEHLTEFPAKERSSLLIGGPELDEANRAFVQKLMRERAPWFTGNVEELGWATDVEFEHRITKRYGQQRCWLVGDAAHQTGPAGMQSMNVGLAEAELLAASVVKVMKENASLEVMETYNKQCREEWRRLLGTSAMIKTRPKTAPWVKDRAARILPCLPGSGDDLKALLSQLELDLA